jgi:Zn-finger nucleic acid-binding protein
MRLLEPPLRRFQCPSCLVTATKRDPRVTTELHPCPKLKGVMVPLVELQPGQHELKRHEMNVRVIERPDYVGAEKGLRFDEDGRPYMAVHTERSDGHDTAVFAPVATARTEEYR